MNLHERVLSVLGCKYVNDVLIDAPLEITPDMIASLRITEVCHGTESDDNGAGVSFGKLLDLSFWNILHFYYQRRFIFEHTHTKTDKI